MQGRAYRALLRIQDAMVFAFAPPPVTELGNSAGFDFYLEGRQRARGMPR